MDEDEIAYMKTLLSKKAEDAKMVEWGSGGSTLMLIPFFKTGKLISIEHNDDWFTKVVNGITEGVAAGELDNDCVGNTVYCLAKPGLDARFYGYGVPYEENPVFAANYICPQIPDADVWQSDIYFVDGICRGAILATIALKANREKNPVVLLHDHHGPEHRQPWYSWATSFYSRVEPVGSTLARLYL